MNRGRHLAGLALLLTICWISAASTVSAAGDAAEEVVAAYIQAAVDTVDEIYASGVDALERSTLIGQAGLHEYWVTSRETTIQGRDSGSAFAALLGFRPDDWELGDFRQAGEFGEIEVTFARTRTFRSGEQSTSSKALVYELVQSEDGWRIAAYRRIEEPDAEVEDWDERAAAVEAPDAGTGPEELVTAQLELLQGLPPQALRSAGEKSAHLWQETREARQGLGRVIGMMTAISGMVTGPLEWRINVQEQGPDSATVGAEVVSDQPLAFRGLVFTVKKTGDRWLLATAAATM